MSFADLISFWLTNSGLSSGELIFLLLSAGVLSPLPRLLIIFAAIRIGFNGVPGKFVCLGLATCLALVQMEEVLSPIVQKTQELATARAPISLEGRRELVKKAEQEWMKFVDQRTSPEIAERIQKVSLSDNTSIGGVRFGRTGLAFLISELQRAFRAALVILLPLLVIELLTATVISALDIPVQTAVISFPLKLALFLSTNGWSQISETLVRING